MKRGPHRHATAMPTSEAASKTLGDGRFSVIRQLGAGGMGVVYEAYDQARRETVALKVVKDSVADRILDFKNEFRTLANIIHPNLVRLQELLRFDDQWLFTMELVRGVDFFSYVRPQLAPLEIESTTSSHSALHLAPYQPSTARTDSTMVEDSSATAATQPSGKQGKGSSTISQEARRAASTRLNEDRLRTALLQLAEGISALHDADIIHRDIKPSNVLVDHSGRVVILDFGLARQRGGPDNHRIAGTPHFMAPELAAGVAGGPAVDWYALGVMLFMALVGQPPFIGDQRYILHRKQYFDAPMASEVVGDVPEDLDFLCTALLARNPENRPRGADILRRLGGKRTSAQLSLPLQSFVGRRAELRSLNEDFDATRDAPVTVFVCGGSGVGKSALTGKFVSQLVRDTPALVLQGRCYERESMPYKAVDEIIDELTRTLIFMPPETVAPLLPADVDIIAQAFPVFRKLLDLPEIAGKSPPSRKIADIQQQRAALFSAIRELFVNLAGYRPIVLVIDDLQWADSDGLAMLAELTRPPGAPALMLLCTLREDKKSPTSHREDELAANFGSPVHRYTLKPLSERESRELASRILLDAGTANQKAASMSHEISRESHGLPFFIELLARSAIEDGHLDTESLDHIISRRIAALPEPETRLLSAVCVAGRPCKIRVLNRVLGREQTSLMSELTRLRSGSWIVTSGTEDDDNVNCYHDRVRTAVLATVTDAEQAQIHTALAQAFATEPVVDSEAMAIHLAGAGKPQEAVAYAEAAARTAMRVLAFDRAARLYRMVLDLNPDIKSASKSASNGSTELYGELGEALVNAGRGAEAAQIFLDLSETSDPLASLRYRRRAAKQLLTSGLVADGLAILRALLHDVGLPYPRSRLSALVRLIYYRIRLRFFSGFKRLRQLRTPKAPAALPEPADVAAPDQQQQQRLETAWAASVGLAMVDNVRGAYYQALCLNMALHTDDVHRIACSLAMEACFLSSGGYRSAARTDHVLAEARKLAEHAGDDHSMAMVDWANGMAVFMRGHWPSAREFFERSVHRLRTRCVGVAWELTTVQRFLCWTLWHQGDIKEQERLLARFLAEAEARGDAYAETGFASNMRFSDDEISRERRKVLEIMGDWSMSRYYLPNHQFLYDLATLEIYEGDGVAAWERLRRGWRSLQTTMALQVEPIRILFTEIRARAAVAAMRLAGARRHKLSRKALRYAAKLRKERAPWAKAHADLIEAGVYAMDDKHAIARSYYGAADEQFTQLGMQGWAMAARDRRGALIGGDEGAALRSQAREYLLAQGMLRPERLISMLAPGPWPPHRHGSR